MMRSLAICRKHIFPIGIKRLTHGLLKKPCHGILSLPHLISQRYLCLANPMIPLDPRGEGVSRITSQAHSKNTNRGGPREIYFRSGIHRARWC
jgi:hypothetical protein